jgi:hypothetical protein
MMPRLRWVMTISDSEILPFLDARRLALEADLRAYVYIIMCSFTASLLSLEKSCFRNGLADSRLGKRLQKGGK